MEAENIKQNASRNINRDNGQEQCESEGGKL